jgi:hypothetical protein
VQQSHLVTELVQEMFELVFQPQLVLPGLSNFVEHYCQ